MTVSLPAYAEAHRGDQMLTYVWLLEIAATTSTTAIRMTESDIDVTLGGNLYSSGRPFTVDGLGSTPEGAVSIGNGDGELGARAALWRAENASPGFTLTELWLDSAGVQQGSYVVLRGTLEGHSWDNQWFHARIEASSVVDSQPALARRWSVGLCTYRAFRGVECGYSGAATTCDRTLATCTALGNSSRWGGVASLPGAGDTISLWFRTYSYRARPEGI